MTSPCIPQCWAAPKCATCGRVKSPLGRSVAAAMAGSMCCGGPGECDGYHDEPRPGHLWPGELDDAGKSRADHMSEIVTDARIAELEAIARAIADADPDAALSSINVTLPGDRRMYLRTAAVDVLAWDEGRAVTP